MATAIAHFVTQQNGRFHYTKGLRVGTWRVSIVADPSGSLRFNARNVLEVPYESFTGLEGVTPRSSYYLGNAEAKARRIAAEYNAKHAQAAA